MLWYIVVAMRRGVGGEMEMMTFVYLLRVVIKIVVLFVIFNDVFG